MEVPNWRRWHAAPIHQHIARAWRESLKTTDLERDLLRVVAISENMEMVERVLPAFMAWVRSETVDGTGYRSAIAAELIKSRKRDRDIARIAKRVKWPGMRDPTCRGYGAGDGTPGPAGQDEPGADGVGAGLPNEDRSSAQRVDGVEAGVEADGEAVEGLRRKVR